MSRLLAYLKLIRWINLAIIALSMYGFRYCVMATYFRVVHVDFSLDVLHFGWLVLAVVLIAAAGNVANAYFDYEQDWEHRPDKTVIGRYLSLDQAFYLQMGLNVAGVLIGFWLSSYIAHARLGYIFLLSALLLFIYSQLLKRHILIGNVVVALLSALVILLPVLFEPLIFSIFHDEYQQSAFELIIIQAKWYAAFVFIISLAREIVKDAEDKDADIAYSYQTLACTTSTMTLNIITAILLSISIVMVIYLGSYFYSHHLWGHLGYSMVMVLIPMLVLLLLAHTARTQSQYARISLGLKLLMLAGLGTMPVFYYFITRG
jgi:4-hydroxybenzoate polyprenyltransferase